MSSKHGKITQIIGPVIDVSFESGDYLPNIFDSLVITKDNGQKVILECQKHIGEDTIRTIAMDASDGLRRGMEVVNTGAPIIMPIGEKLEDDYLTLLVMLLMVLVTLIKLEDYQFTESHQDLKIYLLLPKYYLQV